MAIWHLYRQSDGHLGLAYENRATGALFKCGTVRADTPNALVVSWVVERGRPRPSTRFDSTLRACSTSCRPAKAGADNGQVTLRTSQTLSVETRRYVRGRRGHSEF
jgi:hypothetical protein